MATINYEGFTLSGSAIPGWPLGQTRYYQYADGVSCSAAVATFLALTDAQKVALTTVNPPPPPAGNGPWTVRDCNAVVVTSAGTLLPSVGRTPARQRQRVRVYNNNGKKVDVEVTPADGWQYKAANTTGDYNNQMLVDFNTLPWSNVPASGVITVNAPGDGDNNTAVVRIARKTDPNEYYDTPVRVLDLFDWIEYGGAAAQVAPLAGPRVLDQTRRERLHLVWDRFDGTDSIWKDISGFTRGANSWFWVVGGSHLKIPDNAPLGELRLAQNIITMVYRCEVLPGYNRETGLLQNKYDGTTAVVDTDAVILYTGKP